MKEPMVLEVNARHWLAEMSARQGRRLTLGQAADEAMTGWQQAGFRYVWLMGVWEVGPLARAVAVGNAELRQACAAALPDCVEADLCGSPYAIAGYRVARELGGEAGLRRFRRRLNRQGMGLMLDFIPNHVGLDHAWVVERPGRFVAGVAGQEGVFTRRLAGAEPVLAHGRDPNFPAWADTAQLDYRSAETRAAMLAELGGVADRCDGVRCDMAMLPLNDVFERIWQGFPRDGARPAREFWGEAIGQTKQRHPGCLFLAEAYWDLEATLQNLGFDYTYDKRLYDLLLARETGSVQAHLLAKPAGYVSRSAHFLENHDEVRIAAVLGPEEHGAAAWLTLSLPGLRLLQDGQLSGATRRTPIQLARRAVEAAVDEVETLYRRLLAAAQAGAVGGGQGEVLAPRDAWPGNGTWRDMIVVFWPAGPREFELAVTNLGSHRSQCYVPLPILGLAEGNWRMADRLGAEVYERCGEDLARQGLYLDVAGYATQLFRFEMV
jgi:hypothetical protein